MKIKVLILKMSSMGDVIHTLPAINDMYLKYPEAIFHWVIEENFAEIPSWHPSVQKIIPIALRRWKKSWVKAFFSGEIPRFFRALRAEKYDFVIDAQGLVKSAFIAKLARTQDIYGPDRKSARESLASFFYSRKISVPKAKEQHAVIRLRSLFAQAFSLFSENFSDIPMLGPVEYGLQIPAIDFSRLNIPLASSKFAIFLHGTTWESKHWPVEYWILLGQKLVEQGIDIYLPWGSSSEKTRAEKIAQHIRETGCRENAFSINQSVPSNRDTHGQVVVLERLSLRELAQLFLKSTYIIGVDTGLSHLAAALDCKAVSLFGPTDSVLTGPVGKNQTCLQSNFSCSPCFLKKCNYLPPHRPVSPPCFGSLTPEKVLICLEKFSA